MVRRMVVLDVTEADQHAAGDVLDGDWVSTAPPTMVGRAVFRQVTVVTMTAAGDRRLHLAQPGHLTSLVVACPDDMPVWIYRGDPPPALNR